MFKICSFPIWKIFTPLRSQILPYQNLKSKKRAHSKNAYILRLFLDRTSCLTNYYSNLLLAKITLAD